MARIARSPGTPASRSVLPAVAALLAACVASRAPAAPVLAEKLPAGASILAEADFAAIRQAKVIDRGAWNASGGPSVLERAGLRFRQDVDRVAVAILPALAKDASEDAVALFTGRFDAAKLKQSLIGDGAKAVKLGEIPALRVSGSSSISLHPALPEIDLDGQQLFVSFLGDVLVLGTEAGTRRAHGPKEGLPSPALAAARASVPKEATAWVAVDASTSGTADGVAQGLKSVAAWGLIGDDLRMRAIAKAADAARAKQLAGLASMLAGVAAATPEGKVLSGLDIRAEGDSIDASLLLTAEQVRALTAPDAPATSQAAPAASSAPRR